jgi:hypothetical protein
MKEQARFSKSDKAELLIEITEEQNNAQDRANFNSRVDTGFRITLLAVGIAITAISAILATQKQDPSRNMLFVNLILGALSAGLSGFAFSQYDFRSRSRIWQKISDTYRSLMTELRHYDPDKELFRKKLDVLRSWGNETPIDAQLPS